MSNIIKFEHRRECYMITISGCGLFAVDKKGWELDPPASARLANRLMARLAEDFNMTSVAHPDRAFIYPSLGAHGEVYVPDSTSFVSILYGIMDDKERKQSLNPRARRLLKMWEDFKEGE